MVRPIYLDNLSTTPVDPEVVAAMLPYFTDKFGNAASINHAFGWEAASAIDQARRQIAELINCEPDCLVFTSGATEANNLAIKGVMWAAGAGNQLVTSAAEHRAVLDPARRLARRGHELAIAPVDGTGRVDPATIKSAMGTKTALVSIMLANNEVGTINDLEEIGAHCRERGVFCHTDAAQALGKIPLDMARLPVDLASFSAHKLYGPKGVGVLYVRRGEPRVPLEPLLDGGGHERRLRSGTLPVPLIVGFGQACELARRSMAEESSRIACLRDRLWNLLRENLPGISLNGHPTCRLPGVLNVSIPGVDGTALLTGLTRIAVSSGAACTSAERQPSHVLQAMGVDPSLAEASVRFGIGRFNTQADVDFAAVHLAEVVLRLRAAGQIAGQGES